jgi:hypothetical protein
MKNLLKALVAVCAMSMAGGASASVILQVDASGQLTGATGVVVGNNLYQVTFADGTCRDLYSGCDDAGDFTFQTSAEVMLASQALLDQVFLDSPLGAFDTDFTLTRGCVDRGFSTLACQVLTPFSLLPNINSVDVGIALNTPRVVNSPAHTAGAGARGCTRPSKPICSRRRAITPGAVMAPITRSSPPQLGQRLTSIAGAVAKRPLQLKHHQLITINA